MVHEYKIWDDKAQCDVKIVVGQSAKENWKLIDDAYQNDIWFHLEDVSSPHAIIVVPDKCEISNKTITYAAVLCKSHSKHKSLHRTTLIYTEIKNVSKGKAIGSVKLKKSPGKICV
jgi:predicted ribosome quality control (RQC) complex YloA/Tae2 family protein